MDQQGGIASGASHDSAPHTGPDSDPDPVWCFASADKAHVVIDAAAYFELIREAMMRAEQRILLIGWDFDTRITLGSGRRWWNRKGSRDEPPARLGSFIVWLAKRNPRLEIRVLKWNIGALKMFLRGAMPLHLLRWWRHPQIDFKLDGAHPPGCSHHQKIVVIDDVFAVCGGIDMTGDRWDTRDHIDGDPRRRRPTGRPYKPWHDCTMMMEGEVAAVLGEYGRERWAQAGGCELKPCAPQAARPWPEVLNPEFRNVEIGIARTRSAYGEIEEMREIEALFMKQIAAAKRFVYAESQYFASRRIAEAITRRLKEPDPPEFVIVNPVTADGWLEQTAMDTARARLVRAIQEQDAKGRFSLWHPINAGGTPIYVHAKLLIADDTVLRIGSANMNNRSLGLDSECDVFIDCARSANTMCGDEIARVRHSLLAEHCSLECNEVAGLIERHGSMAAMIAARPTTARHLRRYVLPDLTEVEKSLADNAVLDPERPEDMVRFYRRSGLFRGSILRRPR